MLASVAMPTNDEFTQINSNPQIMDNSQVECLCLLSSCEEDLQPGQCIALLPFSPLCLSNSSDTYNETGNIGSFQEQASMPESYQESPCARDTKLNAPRLSNYASNLYMADLTSSREDNESCEMELPTVATFSSGGLNCSNGLDMSGSVSKQKDTVSFEKESQNVCEFTAVQKDDIGCEKELQDVFACQTGVSTHIPNHGMANLTNNEDKTSGEKGGEVKEMCTSVNESPAQFFKGSTTNNQTDDTRCGIHSQNNCTFSTGDNNSHIIDCIASNQTDKTGCEIKLQKRCGNLAETKCHESNLKT